MSSLASRSGPLCGAGGPPALAPPAPPPAAAGPTCADTNLIAATHSSLQTHHNRYLHSNCSHDMLCPWWNRQWTDGSIHYTTWTHAHYHMNTLFSLIRWPKSAKLTNYSVIILLSGWSDQIPTIGMVWSKPDIGTHNVHPTPYLMDWWHCTRRSSCNLIPGLIWASYRLGGYRGQAQAMLSNNLVQANDDEDDRWGYNCQLF